MKKIRFSFASLGLLICLTGLTALRGDEIVVQESFDTYETDADLQEVWVSVWGGKPKLAKQLTQGTQLVLRNRLLSRELAAPITESFRLCVRLLHSQQNRAQWFGLMNEDLTKGYVGLWDSFSTDGSETRGKFRMFKIDASSKAELEIIPRSAWSTELAAGFVPPGQVTTDQFPSATKEPAPTICLSWEKGGHLTLSCNGEQFLEFTDSTFDSFQQIILSGGDSGIFDEVTLKGK